MIEDNNIDLDTEISSNTIVLDANLDYRGPQGPEGPQGLQGYSIGSIEKISGISESGSVDTYKVKLNDPDETEIGSFDVYNGLDGQGSGDMKKSVYDTNNNGIVDNAERVNNHTVEDDVPSTLNETLEEVIKPAIESSEGSNILIDDALYPNVESLQIEGKSEQETRSGKNIFNKDDLHELNAYFAPTVTTITSSDVNRTLYVPCEPNKDYVIQKISSAKFCFGYTETIPAIGTEVFEVKGSDDAKTYNNKKYQTITTGENAKYLVCRYHQTKQDTTITKQDILNSIQIEEGIIPTEYETYGASPSPDYPSEIKTVKGIRNLFDGITESGGYNNTTGEKTTSTALLRNANPIYVKPNTNYQISNNGTEVLMNVLEYKSDGTFIQHYQNKVGAYITTSSEVSYINIYRGTTEFDKVQIEEGSIAHDYVPYGSWLKVKDTGKNLLPNNIDTQTINGVEIIKRADGSIVLNGTSTTVTRLYFYDKHIKLGAGTYTFSSHKSGTVDASTYMSLVKPDGTDIGSVALNALGYRTHTFDEDTYLLVSLYFGANRTFTDFIIYPQIEPNSIVTEYEPYKEQSMLIDMNKYDEDVGYYELSSINDIKDILTIQNKQATINKRIGKVVLDGHEEWQKQPSAQIDDIYLYNISLADSYVKDTMTISYMSDRFISYTSADLWGNPYIGISLNNSKYLRIRTNIATTTEFKTWLSENPVTVYYELEEPQTITLNGTYDIELFDGTNNISTNDELEPNMIVTAYRNGINGRFYELQKNQEQLEEDINNINNSMAGLNANVDVAMNMASRAEMHATDNEYELAELKDTVNQKMQSDYDSLPVGSVIDYDGDEIPVGYEEVNNILFENESGTTETITLNESVENYNYVEVFYSSTDHNACHSGKLYKPNGKILSMICALYSSGFIRIDANRLTFNGKSVSFYNGGTSVISSTVETTSGNSIKVYRIVGYK